MHLHSTAEAVLGHLEKWLPPVPLVAASRPTALQANARWLATSCRLHGPEEATTEPLVDGGFTRRHRDL
ncbi:hypothetical protein CDV50_11040 [Haematobacter massiliensis]|uniref:Uncharacterized protein n=1 Tax=Haematobacter massiliensis TaxID=195105 RepID=A0A086XYB4_9RHOB|nr:hypothetical protein CN97_02100 [Haematobacter massiliensis]OWJ71035.1 hypothetical protein CDV50_11040 [Haematobacter massiliensis]OWJ88406.1 hypothetical protein CDV51_01830 [Haematobacter massiliensis]